MERIVAEALTARASGNYEELDRAIRDFRSWQNQESERALYKDEEL